MPSLCIDAGPTENAHHSRGVGWCTRRLLRAITADALAARGLTGTYLRRRPLEELAGGGLRWVPRSRSAELTGVDARVSMRTANWWQFADAMTVLPHDVRRAGADVFLATDPNAVAVSRRFRTVSVLYDLIPDVFPREHFHGRMGAVRRALHRHRTGRAARADHVVAISEATRRDAIERLGIEPARISVVHLAVDREVFHARDHAADARWAAARFDLDRPYLLYVGEADQRKNLLGLARAVLDVAERHDVLLVVAGAVRGRTVAVQEQIRAIDPKGRVRWLGYVTEPELAALYGGAVALGFPSLYEGFGLPLVEAMSCGTPVVTSPVSAMPEIAGDAALYADPLSHDALVDALDRVVTDSGLRGALSERGLARASAFTWERTAHGMLDACARVAHAPRER